ncbi:hypothetical protein [Olleya sp. Bg11-27]|uniref:hypothetical protein n=1 Tax=Olleya sp. Bg11-27 TaxID=2058135 RepID=UPI000C30AAE2|nr:hypothetical protein [Olleya sp. Bg11-27]AUC76104.1 hypothetical protein CW732_10695 [Olleya sp. Bg11-27]
MKNTLSLLFFLSIIIFTGCESILECVINRSPELPDKSFTVGYRQQMYYDEFEAQIKNDPHDDSYGYNFELEGTLPEGVSMTIDYRIVRFEGMPQNQGIYDFTIFLYVDPPLSYDEETEDYEDSMCSTSTSKNYTIIIE